MPPSIPLPVQRALLKLGADLSLARRRRHVSQASLAERMGASLSTVRRMEKGDARVPIHFFARALHVFGELQALEHLLDTPKDEIGLAQILEFHRPAPRALATDRHNSIIGHAVKQTIHRPKSNLSSSLSLGWHTEFATMRPTHA